MNRPKRPIEAILPVPSRPQVVNIGKRRRIDHLSKNTRLFPETTPFGLPNEKREYKLENTPGRSHKGLAYRNAVFQALLNTPMFVNFLRMHDRRWPMSIKSCPIGTNCLSCAMYRMADQYWLQTSNTDRAQRVQIVYGQLWAICRETFWPKTTQTGSIGPADVDEEYYSDAFLLNLLTEIRSQLELSPSEYQTFEKLFTVHIARRWKCSGAFCHWVSNPYKWESSLHLSLVVQKQHPKSRQTPVLLGIRRALHAPTRLAARRASLSHRTKCERCNKLVESSVDIVNLPEILILIRDTEELSPEDDPDIPFREELNMSSLASGPDDEFDPKRYELVSGIGEHRYNRVVSRNYAFARGAEDISNKWFCMLDENVVELGFDQLERLQRSITDGGLAGEGVNPLCPEILLYRRKDYDEHTRVIDSFGPISPLNDISLTRDVMSSSINDIFIQKIGRGLLKFKVKMVPVTTATADEIEGDLQLSYELDGKHYSMKLKDGQNFLGFQLKSLRNDEQAELEKILTPFEGRVIDRAVKRIKGVYVSEEEAQAQISSFAAQQNLPDSNILTGNTGYWETKETGTKNPFTENSDSMEGVIDTQSNWPWKNNPEMEALRQTSDKKHTEELLTRIANQSRYHPNGNDKRPRTDNSNGGAKSNRGGYGNNQNRGQKNGSQNRGGGQNNGGQNNWNGQDNGGRGRGRGGKRGRGRGRGGYNNRGNN